MIRAEGDKWIAIELMNIPVPALEQSYLRTKARTYAEYSKTMELQANSSNNTIFADADGDIAYWHGNFIPRRDTRFDYTKPVDGSDPATDWHGLLTLGRDAAAAQSSERISVQRERFAVERGWGELVEEGGLPCLCGAWDRVGAGGACDAGA